LILWKRKQKILASVADRPYFSKGNFVLYNADCLKIMAQLPENSIDMIFADPLIFFPAAVSLAKTERW
jgi:DNA modification methylase